MAEEGGLVSAGTIPSAAVVAVVVVVVLLSPKSELMWKGGADTDAPVLFSIARASRFVTFLRFSLSQWFLFTSRSTC